MADDPTVLESSTEVVAAAAPSPLRNGSGLRSLVSQLRPTLIHVRREQRDVLVAFSVALFMNLALWLMRRVWFPFNPSIAWSGSLILGLNGILALIFARKGHVFVQALAVTAVVVELLLLILIVRTGTAGAAW